MIKQTWTNGNLALIPPKLKKVSLLENYLVFEILEDGQLGFKVPLINNLDLSINNRISYSKDKKTWIHTDINEYIPVKKGEVWYCKGECSSTGTYSIGLFSGINDLTNIKYNVSGNISAILDIRKENPDTEKIMIEMIEVIGLEISNLQSPEEILSSEFGEETSIIINAIKYSDKNKTPAHFRNFLIAMGVPDVPGLSDEEFIKQFIIEELAGPAVRLLSSSCIALCLLLGSELGYLECSPKLDTLFQSEDVVDASGLVIDYSTTCDRMFYGCYNLTKAPKLPMTTLADYCYRWMFYDCTSLTTAPELPATTLAEGCYEYMFDHCNKLNNITMLATNISADNCLNGWVSDVASNGTFIKHPDMTILPSSVSGIPEGWTVEDAIV